MKTVRARSTPVQFYNEGLIVFLYDEGNAEAIRQAGPTLLEGFGEAAIADPVLAGLARDGLLVAFELEQDDDVRIEVAVGAPLTRREGRENWLPPQRAPVDIPTGRLRVEGYNNLSLAPGTDPEDAPGATVPVPAGRYILSLYRRPPQEEPDDRDDSAAGERPRHVVILTKAAKARPVEEVRPMLCGPTAPTTPVENWVGSYEIRHGVFQGLAKGPPRSTSRRPEHGPAGPRATWRSGGNDLCRLDPGASD